MVDDWGAESDLEESRECQLRLVILWRILLLWGIVLFISFFLGDVAVLALLFAFGVSSRSWNRRASNLAGNDLFGDNWRRLRSRGSGRRATRSTTRRRPRPSTTRSTTASCRRSGRTTNSCASRTRRRPCGSVITRTTTGTRTTSCFPGA